MTWYYTTLLADILIAKKKKRRPCNLKKKTFHEPLQSVIIHLFMLLQK